MLTLSWSSMEIITNDHIFCFFVVTRKKRLNYVCTIFSKFKSELYNKVLGIECLKGPKHLFYDLSISTLVEYRIL